MDASNNKTKTVTHDYTVVYFISQKKVYMKFLSKDCWKWHMPKTARVTVHGQCDPFRLE